MQVTSQNDVDVGKGNVILVILCIMIYITGKFTKEDVRKTYYFNDG